MLIVKQNKLLERIVHVERGDLTDREFATLELLCKGNTSHQISEEWVVSHHTIRRHLKHLREKFDAHNSQQLVAFAYMDGLIK